MAERKGNKKYVFTVEGECERLYLEHLQKLINGDSKSIFTVEIKAIVTAELSKTAKTFNPVTIPQPLYHLCDVESESDEHVARFESILRDLRTVKEQKYLKYELGYSNFTFDLWMILHKNICNGCSNHRKEYLRFINKEYKMSFSSMDEYKERGNFQKCLDQLTLVEIKEAINRAKNIMNIRERQGDKEIPYCGYKYYKSNPALTIWKCIEKILKDCKLA